MKIEPTHFTHSLAFLCILFQSCITTAQIVQPVSTSEIMTDLLPYSTIPDYPESYTAATVTARLIDGLGFRYHWASEALNEEDLAYRPDSTARSSMETMEHIYGLSVTILNGIKDQPNIRPYEEVNHSWEEMRAHTLDNFKSAADLMRTMPDQDLAELEITFQRGDKKSSFPFWHQFNGPIADAIWHVGQVVTFRRASGNPIDSRVNVFMGNVRER